MILLDAYVQNIYTINALKLISYLNLLYHSFVIEG